MCTPGKWNIRILTTQELKCLRDVEHCNGHFSLDSRDGIDYAFVLSERVAFYGSIYRIGRG